MAAMLSLLLTRTGFPIFNKEKNWKLLVTEIDVWSCPGTKRSLVMWHASKPPHIVYGCLQSRLQPGSHNFG